jgi:hypothetical protein
MMVSLKMAVFWDIVLCNLNEVDHCFRGAYCFHHQGDECLMMEAVCMHL